MLNPDFFRVPGIVGVQESDQFSSCNIPACISCSRGAGIYFQRDDLDPVVSVLPLYVEQRVQGVVTAAIIDKDDFKGPAGLCRNRAYGATYCFTAPVTGHNHGHWR
jgi:hypothetical protein